MSNPSNAKGTNWEQRLVAYLTDQGLNPRRMPPAGRLGVVDITVTHADADADGDH